MSQQKSKQQVEAHPKYCYICCKISDDPRIFLSKCLHRAHAHCLVPWLYSHDNKCPICNQKSYIWWDEGGKYHPNFYGFNKYGQRLTHPKGQSGNIVMQIYEANDPNAFKDPNDASDDADYELSRRSNYNNYNSTSTQSNDNNKNKTNK